MTQGGMVFRQESTGHGLSAALIQPSSCFTYDLDAEDHVAAVCPDWDPLTEAFSPSGPRACSLVGSSIYSHFTGRECREIYRLLFARTRQQQTTLEVPFRCDGPTVRRQMKLQIRLLPERRLRVTSLLLHEETRPYVALLDVAVPRSQRLLDVCAWCKRVEVASRWLEVEEAVECLRLFAHTELPEISHGMCPDCGARFLGGQ